MYAIPLLYRLSTSTNHVSIKRIHQALQSTITKHQILRTALYLDINSTLIQHCLDVNVISDHANVYGFSILNLANNDCPLNKIIYEILSGPDLFDLSKGRVIHCHIIRQYRTDNHSTSDHDDLLMNNDLILFSIYHGVFDGSSVSIFIRDLFHAYENNDLLSINSNTLQYIDYSVYERLINTTLSHNFLAFSTSRV